MAFIQGTEGTFRLWACEVDLDTASGTWSLSRPPTSIELGEEEVRCCTVIDRGRLAIGYGSGRLEIVAAEPNSQGSKQVQAVGFTWSAPSDLRVARVGGAVYLVAVAGGIVWYELPACVVGQ